jgi:hypothetical protein
MEYGNVIPIVKTFFKPLSNMDDITKAVGLGPIITGGKVAKPVKKTSRKKPKTSSKEPEPKAEVEMQTEMITIDTKATTSNRIVFLKDLRAGSSKIYHAAEGQTIDICGFLLLHDEPAIKYYIRDIPGNMAIKGRMKSGSFSNDYLHSEYLYAASRRFSIFQDMGAVEVPNMNALQILFTQTANVVASALFDYLVFITQERIYTRPTDWVTLGITHLDEFKLSAKLSPEMRWIVDNIKEPSKEPVKSATKYKSPTISGTLNKFYDMIEKHFPAKFNLMFASSAPEDIRSIGLSSIAERVAYHNSIVPGVNDAIEKRDMYNAVLVNNAIANAVYLSRSVQELQYRAVYATRFGKERLRAITSKLPSYDMTKVNKLRMFGSIMDHVSAQEKKIILAETTRMEKLTKAIEERGKLPWADVYRRLRNATDINKKLMLLENLEQYLPKGYESVKTDWIKTEKDGVPIICPHVILLIKLRSERKTDSQIQDKLQPFLDAIVSYSSYYCKICGEKLYTPEEMDSYVVIEGEEFLTIPREPDADLREWMWKQASYMIRSNVEFADILSDRVINKFTTTFVGILYEFIHLIKKKLSAVKTDTDQQVDDKMKVYMSIYSWSLIIKITTENKGKMTITSSRKLNKIDDMFKHARNRMMNSLNTVFTRITDMELTEKFLDGSLRKAYQNLQGLVKKSTLRVRDDEDIMQILDDDAYFIYVANMRGLSALQRANLSGPFTGRSQVVNNVKVIMKGAETPEAAVGKKVSEIQSGDVYVYGNVPEMSFRTTPKSLSERTTLQYEIIIESIKYVLDYLKAKAFMDPVHNVDITKEGNSFIINVYPTDKQKTFNEKSSKIAVKEKRLWRIIKDFYTRAFATSPAKKTRRYKEKIGSNSLALAFGYEVNKNANETKLFTGQVKESWKSAKESYHRHKWDINVYARISAMRPDKHLSDYKQGDLEIVSGSDAKKTADFAFIDMMCSRCFFTRSMVENGAKDIIKYEEMSIEIANFYRFFEFQCPELLNKKEIAHVFKNETCKYCGFKKEYAKAPDFNVQYYKKYIEKYKKERKEQSHIGFAQTSEMPAATSQSISAPIKSWKYQPAITSEFADATFDLMSDGSKLSQGPKQMKINKKEYLNLVNNIALTDGIELDDIIKGKASPYRDISPDLAEARSTKLQALVNELIFNYMALVNYKNIAKPDQYAKELVDSATASDIKAVSEFPGPQNLVPLRTKYALARKEMYAHADGNSVTMANFDLYYLLKFVTGIISLAKTEKLSKDFSKELALYFLNRIMYADKTFASAKASRIAALQATQKISAADDPNMVDNRQTRMFDELVDPEYMDKFSYDNVDYDGHNDDY